MLEKLLGFSKATSTGRLHLTWGLLLSCRKVKVVRKDLMCDCESVTSTVRVIGFSRHCARCAFSLDYSEVPAFRLDFMQELGKIDWCVIQHIGCFISVGYLWLIVY